MCKNYAVVSMERDIPKLTIGLNSFIESMVCSNS